MACRRSPRRVSVRLSSYQLPQTAQTAAPGGRRLSNPQPTASAPLRHGGMGKAVNKAQTRLTNNSPCLGMTWRPTSGAPGFLASPGFPSCLACFLAFDPELRTPPLIQRGSDRVPRDRGSKSGFCRANLFPRTLDPWCALLPSPRPHAIRHLVIRHTIRSYAHADGHRVELRNYLRAKFFFLR